MKKLTAWAMVALCSLSALSCGTASQVVQKVEIKTIDCAAITSPETANDALAKGQTIRIAARDFVADLYIAGIMSRDAVFSYDEKIDKPFTKTYAEAREKVDGGMLDGFKAICETFKASVDALLPVVSGGAQ